MTQQADNKLTHSCQLSHRRDVSSPAGGSQHLGGPVVALAILHPEGVGPVALEPLWSYRLHQVLGLKVAGLAGDCPEPVGVLRRQVFPIHHVHLRQMTPWPQHRYQLQGMPSARQLLALVSDSHKA